MRGPIAGLGAGFVAGLFATTLSAALGIGVYRYIAGEDRSQPFPPPELAIWVAGSAVGAFAGSYLARRIFAALTTTGAAILGLAIFAADGLNFMSETLPPVFWLAGALGCIAAAVVGAAAAGPANGETPPRSESAPSVLEEPRHPPVGAWMGVPGRSFLERTGQLGRVRSGNAMVIVGGGLILLGNLSTSDEMASVAVGTALSVCGFAWLCLAIRCPSCRLRVVWHTLSTVNHWGAYAEAQDQEACPKCGYAPP